MNHKLGFIGGGRITRIFLDGMILKKSLPGKIVVTETDESLYPLFGKYPSVILEKEINDVLFQDYIFISLHPPVIKNVIDRLKNISRKTLIISLAPKLTIKWFHQMLGEEVKIVRCIPNAPSVTGAGFNPVSFSDSVTHAERKQFIDFLDIFGRSRIVPEDKLEAYAILTAMGPTYLWFQLYELKNLSMQFGLSEDEANEGISEMVKGSVDLLISGMDCSRVMDLIPVRPLAEYESQIKEFYDSALKSVYNKIKP